MMKHEGPGQKGDQGRKKVFLLGDQTQEAGAEGSGDGEGVQHVPRHSTEIKRRSHMPADGCGCAEQHMHIHEKRAMNGRLRKCVLFLGGDFLRNAELFTQTEED